MSTDKKNTIRVTEALTHDEAQYRNFVENTTDWLWEMALDGRHTYSNHQVETILGYSSEEITKPSLTDIVHPVDIQDIRERLPSHIAEKRGWRGWVVRFRHKDGGYRYLESNAEPILDATGAVRGFRGIDRDITKRMQATEAMQTKHRQLNEAEEIAHVGSFEYDIVSDTLIWSDELYRIYGVDSATFNPTYENFLARVHPDERDAVQQSLSDAIQQAQPFQREERIIRPDGEARLLDTRGQIIVSEDGLPVRVIGASQDITERRKLEQQLAETQRMDAMGQLTRGVAHDFNNLLTAIVVNLECGKELVTEDESVRSSIQAALDASFRGAELVKRLLAFSRRQTLTPQITNVNNLVTALQPLLDRTLGGHMTIEMKLAEGLWLTAIDRAQLESALINLAVNAQDAMPGGGTLTIKTTNTAVEEVLDTIRTGALSPGEYVLLSVSDTGTGMSEEVMKRVFEPFFTTKEPSEGTGLGLSMVYGFVRQSRGYIEVDSVEGAGTTFKLYLRRYRPATEATGTRSTKSTRTLLARQGTILIVEDDAAVRWAVSKLLKDLGYRVVEAGSGAEALPLLDEHEDIDLLFTDVVMPGGMDGRELATRARQRRPKLKVLYTSGYYEATDQYRGLLAHEERMLKKPFQK